MGIKCSFAGCEYNTNKGRSLDKRSKKSACKLTLTDVTPELLKILQTKMDCALLELHLTQTKPTSRWYGTDPNPPTDTLGRDIGGRDPRHDEDDW